MTEPKKEQMLCLVMFICNKYKGKDFRFAKSLISHNFEETVEKLHTAYEESRQAFKKRMLEPIKIPADTVAIDYSAAFEKLTATKIMTYQLKKYSKHALIAKQMLERIGEPVD
ncbi:hypothetical protein [Apilactobacillus apinorum]|uniref:hypothetical protein n=1 Tax=Apilactobacillus apinorum TaxID=1218495 RepID=UPI0006B4116F|nr:hypothetical protein [Apilactobacillus apinorum]KOY68737.1 hypothetical protein RZ74_05350 [Apilactobacillus apinorum]CAI2656862.1 Hypothetical protein AAPFHON13_05820 [Apilactobacillus apinorum]